MALRIAISSCETIPPTISASLNSSRPPRLQHAENFTQQPEAPRHMTQHIVRKHGIEALIRDWQRLRGITLLEPAKRAQLLLLRQSVRISDPFGVQVQANNVAAVSLCQMQCVTSRTAT